MKLTKRLPRFLFCLFVFSVATNARAEEILVESTPLHEEETEASPSVTVLDAKQIQQKNAATVADLLRDIPGVETIRQGGVGQTTSVFIRGARSEDTLVLIDGMEANDAMSPACGFDFSSLTPDNIERIEVFRGPQSVRFGAGALGGVINIVTKEGKGPLHSNYFTEAGSYHTNRESLALSGEKGQISYSASAENFYTQGFSAADVQEGNMEPDGAKVKSLSSKIIWRASNTAQVTGTFRYTKANIDLDARGGPGGDDPNDTSAASQSIAGLTASERFWHEQLKSSLGLYYAEVHRADDNPSDPNNPDSSSDVFVSENKKIETNQELTLSDASSALFGVQWRKESGRTSSDFDASITSLGEQEQSTLGESLSYLYDDNTWLIDAGARLDESSEAGTIPDYKASLSRSIFSPDTRLLLSYGTGFKLPSLYELYSLYGNPNLHWERSNTFDASLEQKITESLTGSITYFDSHYRQLIDYDTASNKYFNVSAAKSNGVELQATAQIHPHWSANANYTYLDARDETTGLHLIRRPQNTWSLNGRYEKNALELLLQYRHVGERADIDPISFQNITDNPYNVVNLGASYKIWKQLKLHARIENLFNEKYEEVAGYGTAGFSYYFGLSGEI